MKLLIKNAIVCDVHSPFNGKKCDIHISGGVIEDLRPSSPKSSTTSTRTLDAEGAFISPGFTDMRASLREPGYEFKEDLASAANAAAAGGYTSICALPDTSPAIQHKSDVEFIRKRGEELPVHILPLGAVTHNREGKDMNELFDMHQAGAVAFTDGNRSLMHTGVMMRALEYARIFDGLVLSHPEDTNLSAGGRMHEGTVSVNLGLKGIPPMAEELMITRDIELARYTGSRIHFSHISSKGSVSIIRQAKRSGLPVTCDVAVANLVFTDENLSGFDSNFKLTPPLRTKSDRTALWAGLADGSIDCIVSDHFPEDTEHKEVEFEYASQGMIMLQTALSLLLAHKPGSVPTETVINALTHNPRTVLRQQAVSLTRGSIAELCIFDTRLKWKFNPASNLSKSSNSPVMGQLLDTKVIATVNKDKLFKHA